MDKRTIQIDPETYEKIAAQAEYIGTTPGDIIELGHVNCDPSTVPELEGYLCRCPECRCWSRPATCWRCGVEVGGT